MSKTETSSTTHQSLWRPTSYAIIFGSFNLGLFVAIQGPTLMDLIDLLHINNDTMSVTLAFASLAYSAGGLLSGVLFNYVARPVLITVLFTCFGLCNILTPFITNYFVFTVITCFKMICAGGTDCGASVWILDIWPGKDEWLQALHFTFAIGTALGPLIVEPFLSADYAKSEQESGHSSASGLAGIKDKTSGSSTISDQNNETRIHVPFILSGLLSVLAGFIILFLHLKSERLHRAQRKTSPLQLEMGQQQLQLQLTPLKKKKKEKNNAKKSQEDKVTDETADKPKDSNAVAAESPALEPASSAESSKTTCDIEDALKAANDKVEENGMKKDEEKEEPRAEQMNEDKEKEENQDKSDEKKSKTKDQELENSDELISKGHGAISQSSLGKIKKTSISDQQSSHLQITIKDDPIQVEFVEPVRKKITSRTRDDRDGGRPPYYVMFAVALAAMSLSFYCGIEITSMNYLATFAVNIDLQLSKSTAALMSSALTISFAVGRGLGVYMAARMKPHKLFYICTFTMIIGNILMLIFANAYEILLWFSVCLFGLGCAPLYPAVVSFFDTKITKVTNTVSGIFISGSMFNVALNSLIIGHHIIDNALILLFCNLAGSIVLLFLFGTLHMLTKVKTNQRVRKYELKQKKSSELKQLQVQSLEQSAEKEQQSQQPQS